MLWLWSIHIGKVSKRKEEDDVVHHCSSLLVVDWAGTYGEILSLSTFWFFGGV